MWRAEIFFPAIFAFLEIFGNARTFLRTYDFGTGTKNEKKFLQFVISILITAKNGKEISPLGGGIEKYHGASQFQT